MVTLEKNLPLKLMKKTIIIINNTLSSSLSTRHSEFICCTLRNSLQFVTFFKTLNKVMKEIAFNRDFDYGSTAVCEKSLVWERSSTLW